MAIGRRIGTAASRATITGMGWALLAYSAWAQPPLVTVETRTDTLVGELVVFDPEQGVGLQRDNPVRLPMAEVLGIRFDRRASPSIDPSHQAGELTLVDGGRLTYGACEQNEDSLVLRLTGSSRSEVRLSSVRRWWFGRERSTGDHPKVTGRVADVLWVKPKQGEAVSPVEGVVLGVLDDGVRFAFNSEEPSDPVVAPWDRLAGIEFFREALSDPAPAFLVTLADGGRFAADDIRIHGGRLEWSSRHGNGDLDLLEIEAIDSSAGRVTPVSALKLLEAAWRPYYDLGGSGLGYALDSSLAGGALRLREPDPRAPQAWPAVGRERAYTTGIALKSRGEARFALPEDAVRLKGRIGLDPGCVRSGSAEVALLADERVVWSGTVDGTTRPAELNAPLDGATTLTLRVEYGDNLDAGDHVHFAELRVIQ